MTMPELKSAPSDLASLQIFSALTYKIALSNPANILDRRMGEDLLQDIGKSYEDFAVESVQRRTYSRGILLFAGLQDSPLGIPHIVTPSSVAHADPHSYVAQTICASAGHYMKDKFWPFHNWRQDDGSYLIYANTAYGRLGTIELMRNVAMSFVSVFPGDITMPITHTAKSGTWVTKKGSTIVAKPWRVDYFKRDAEE